MAYSACRMELPEHKQALVGLWKDMMNDAQIGAQAEPRARWLYHENPGGQATTVLGLQQETGEVIGCGSALPRMLVVDGKLLRAGLLGDFAVAPGHRTAD